MPVSIRKQVIGTPNNPILIEDTDKLMKAAARSLLEMNAGMPEPVLSELDQNALAILDDTYGESVDKMLQEIRTPM